MARTLEEEARINGLATNIANPDGAPPADITAHVFVRAGAITAARIDAVRKGGVEGGADFLVEAFVGLVALLALELKVQPGALMTRTMIKMQDPPPSRLQ